MCRIEPLHDEIGNLNANYDVFGEFYSDNCRLQDAERMYKHALAGYEKALGAENTSTLGTVNNLGLFYADQGHFTEAETL